MSPVDPADVPSRTDLEAVFRERLPAVADQLIATLEPAIRFRAAPSADAPALGSRFGGQPYLPHDRAWPVWEHPTQGERPLWFFAQIDLAEAHAVAPASMQLPSDGLLSFFADLDDELDGVMGLYSWEHPGSTIMHSRPGADLRVLDGPSHGRGIRLAPLSAWTWRQDDIDFSNDEFDILDEVDNWYAKALQGIVAEGYHHGGRHQLGGHENYIQHPAANEVVQAMAGCYEGDWPGHFDYERWQTAQPQVAEWRLALQIDSDEALNVMWGDVGTLFWMMRRSDIESARWDRCMFNFQSC